MSSPLLKSHGSLVPKFPDTLKNALLELPQITGFMFCFSSIKLEHKV